MPFETIYSTFNDNVPVFSPDFFKYLVEYCSFHDFSETLCILNYLIKGPLENRTRLGQYNIIPYLISNSPSTFPLIYLIIHQNPEKFAEQFVYNGGIYCIMYFSKYQECLLIITKILNLVSFVKYDYNDDILPLPAFLPMKCTYDTTAKINFSKIVNRFINNGSTEIVLNVLLSLYNIFQFCNNTVKSIGPVILIQFHTIMNVIELQIPAIKLLQIIVAEISIDNIWDIVDTLFHYLEISNEELLLNLLDLLNIICEHYGNNILVDQKFLNSFLSIYDEGSYQIKCKMIEIIITITEDASSQLLKELIMNNMFQILIDFIKGESNPMISLAIDSYIEVLSKTLYFAKNIPIEILKDAIYQLTEIVDHQNIDCLGKIQEGLALLEKLCPNFFFPN